MLNVHKQIPHNGEINPVYIKGKIMEAMTSDERIAEHDIRVYVSNQDVITKGEVYTEEQKRAVDEVVRVVAPQFEFKNQVEVRILKGPEGCEAIR